MEALGNALFSPYVLEYADKPTRMRSVIARLEKIPRFLDQASVNLISSPRIWTGVAIEENQGNIDLVDKTIRGAVPDELREAYGKAAGPALAAMTKFQEYLNTSLSGRDQADWRLGRYLYTRKFRYTLESGMEPDAVLAAATADLGRVRAACWSWRCRCIGRCSARTASTPTLRATSASTAWWARCWDASRIAIPRAIPTWTTRARTWPRRAPSWSVSTC